MQEKCFYCGRLLFHHRAAKGTRIPLNAFTLDHLIPRCQGGVGRQNKVPACYACNLDKAHLTLEEYRLVMAFRKGIVDQPTLVAHRFAGEAL